MIAKIPLSSKDFKIYKLEKSKLEKMFDDIQNEEDCNQFGYKMDLLINAISSSKYALKMEPELRKKVQRVFDIKFTNIQDDYHFKK